MAATILHLTTGVVYLRSGSGLTLTGATTITRAGIGVTSTDGLILNNTTAAAVGAQQMSPRVRFDGFGWKTDATAASQAVSFINEMLPVEGASAPTANLLWKYSVNGGAYATRLTLTSAGQLLGVDGTVDIPSFSFATQPNSGLYMLSGGNGPTIASQGVPIIRFAATPSVDMRSDTLIRWAADTTITTAADLLVARTAAAVLGVRGASSATASIQLGVAGGATAHRFFPKKVTGIADNTTTAVFTVTIPNANHAAAIRLLFLSSNGSTDAFESNRAAQGLVVVQRNIGVVAVVTATAIADGVIATNATGGSATHTLAYAVTAVAGAAGDPNTFTIDVTIDDSGNLGSNQVVALAELLNAEATGITIA